MKSNNCFEQGYQACLDGFFVQSNPYPYASKEAADWQDGWHEADPIRAEMEQEHAEMLADD